MESLKEYLEDRRNNTYEEEVVEVAEYVLDILAEKGGGVSDNEQIKATSRITDGIL